MKKILGISGLLLFVCVVAAVKEPNFLKTVNIENIIRWTSLFSLIAIGVAFVIITGGIDLSIGSLIGLVGSLLAWLLTVKGWSPGAGLSTVLCLSLVIGLLHGLLITKMRLQSFVVTLCGLLLYRGFARIVTDDQSQGFGNAFEGLRQVATASWTLPFKVPDHLFYSEQSRVPFGLPFPFLIMLVVGLLAAVFLNRTIYGRYLLALGRNETAARYSGINTDAMKIIAYMICSGMAGIGGILFALNLNSVQPSGLGEFYELYAIAGAVLGGCSLRGGEGTIIGVIVGTAVMRVLYNAINILRIPTQWEFVIIGAVILSGVIVDELVKRLAAKRRAARTAAR
jgi:ribose transport system permease protein